MSVIAWKDGFLAADMQGTSGGSVDECHKTALDMQGNVCAWTGTQGAALIMLNWWNAGADPRQWPKYQDTDDWTRFIIVAKDKPVIYYEKWPVIHQCHEDFFAWGSGDEYAIGAMAFGATAAEAVRVACQYSNSCGVGVQTYNLRTGEMAVERFPRIRI